MSDTLKDGGPAFPQPMTYHPVHGPLFPESWAPNTGGMSLRAWLAGQALKGLLSNPQFEPVPLARYAMHSCLLADALIAELKKGEG